MVKYYIRMLHTHCQHLPGQLGKGSVHSPGNSLGAAARQQDAAAAERHLHYSIRPYECSYGKARLTCDSRVQPSAACTLHTHSSFLSVQHAQLGQQVLHGKQVGAAAGFCGRFQPALCALCCSDGQLFRAGDLCCGAPQLFMDLQYVGLLIGLNRCSVHGQKRPPLLCI